MQITTTWGPAMRWNDLFGSEAYYFPSHDVFEVVDYSKPFQETCPILLVAMVFK